MTFRLDRLAAIIVSQFFEYFRLTRSETRGLSLELDEAMKHGYELWVRGMIVCLSQERYSVQSDSDAHRWHEVDLTAKRCTCSTFNKYGKVILVDALRKLVYF